MLAHQDILPLITTTSEAFSEAMKKGIGSSPMPSAMRSMLQNNVFIFSGFKTHAQLSAVSALLLDEKGKKKPFDTFLQDVKAIDKTYNQTYLRAEYNFATQSARSAAQWADYQKDGDMFNLQYRTAGDERVRESHMLLNHTTLPLSDPFWKKYFPPNGWNCRCTAVQVRKSKYPLSDSASAIAFGEKATTAYNSKGRNALAIFRFNPGMEHKIFPPRHPYLPKGCGKCNYKLEYKPGSEKCYTCRLIQNCWLNYMKTEQGKIRTHYLEQMQHLKELKIAKPTSAPDKPIIIQFTQYGNKHLYNDSLKHSAVIDKDDLKNLGDILSSATFIQDAPIYKKRKDDFVHFYYYQAELNHHKVILNVGKEEITKKNGKKHYRYILYAITEKLSI